MTYYVSSGTLISTHSLTLIVWAGLLSTELTGKISALLKRLRRFGYTNRVITVFDLVILTVAF